MRHRETETDRQRQTNRLNDGATITYLKTDEDWVCQKLRKSQICSVPRLR